MTFTTLQRIPGVRTRAASTLRTIRATTALLVALGIVACGETDTAGPPMPGSMAVTTETSGFLTDDGYELLVDGVSAGTIGANDVVTVTELEAGTYDVSLADVADNCAVAALSVDVVSDQTAEALLIIACAHAEPASQTLRFTRDRPDLDAGEIVDCLFGLCPSPDGWDYYVHYNSQTTPHSVIRQNQTTGVAIAHLPGVALANLSPADVAGATFNTSLIADPFGADRVILIRTDQGLVYALSNPVEDLVRQTLTLDAALIARP